LALAANEGGKRGPAVVTDLDRRADAPVWDSNRRLWNERLEMLALHQQLESWAQGSEREEPKIELRQLATRE
jgi:hypothetical protein